MALVTGMGMETSARTNGRRGSLAAALLAVGLCGIGFSVQAEPISVETRALYNRLEKLERDLIDVQRQTYQAGPAARSSATATGFGPEPASAADLSLRLQAAEENLRTLNGRLEEMAHDLAQTQARLQRFAGDVEFRFQELGAAGGQALAASGSAATAPPSQSGLAAAAGVGTLGTIPLASLPTETEEDLNQRTLAATTSANAPTYAPGTYPPAGGAPADGTALQAGPEDAYEAAINQLKRGQFDIAEAEFANFLQRYPTHNLAGNAQYWLGETFYVRGAYRQAAEAFLTGYTTYVASSKAPDSLLKLGMTLAALGQQTQACATLGELTRRFPSASQAVSQRAQLERTRAGC